MRRRASGSVSISPVAGSQRSECSFSVRVGVENKRPNEAFKTTNGETGPTKTRRRNMATATVEINPASAMN